MSNNEAPSPQPAADPDLHLVRQARSGNYSAFEELVTRYQDRVYGLAYRIVSQPHDAEDVTQQTFLSLIEHLQDFREESTVAAWILRIAANHALKHLRKRRGLRTVSINESRDDTESYGDLPHPQFIAPWRHGPQELVERREVRELIDQALDALDEKYRTVFVLRDVEGFTVRETAELLGLNEANVKVRLLRARLALRERLTQAFGDEAAQVYATHHHESPPSVTGAHND